MQAAIRVCIQAEDGLGDQSPTPCRIFPRLPRLAAPSGAAFFLPRWVGTVLVRLRSRFAQATPDTLRLRSPRGWATRNPKGEAWWARQDSNQEPDDAEAEVLAVLESSKAARMGLLTEAFARRRPVEVIDRATRGVLRT